MKKLMLSLLAVFLLTGTQAFGAMEPRYNDRSETIASLQKLKRSCPPTNPQCSAVCSAAISQAITLDQGDNITFDEAEALKQSWWNCYNTLIKR